MRHGHDTSISLELRGDDSQALPLEVQSNNWMPQWSILLEHGCLMKSPEQSSGEVLYCSTADIYAQVFTQCHASDAPSSTATITQQTWKDTAPKKDHF